MYALVHVYVSISNKTVEKQLRNINCVLKYLIYGKRSKPTIQFSINYTFKKCIK